jgi:HAD superfamily hydrolase (TIGR01509 family)
MIKNLIFDVDGTLIDTVDLHARAWHEALQHFGKDAAYEEVRFQIGKGGDQLMPVFWSKEELNEKEEEISKWRKHFFEEECFAKVRPFPQVRQLMQMLLGEGKQIALASSALGEELEEYKKIAEIDDLIQTATSSDDAERSKPHPDIFAAALEKLGNPSVDETLVIGDTPYDIEAARKIGLRTIAVRCGGFPEDSLREAIAIYDDPADLLARYRDSPLAR